MPKNIIYNDAVTIANVYMNYPSRKDIIINAAKYINNKSKGDDEIIEAHPEYKKSFENNCIGSFIWI